MSAPVAPAEEPTLTDPNAAGAPSPTATSATATTRRLRFAPAARTMWRSTERLQIELADRAVMVDGLKPETVTRLGESSGPGASAAEHPLLNLLQQGGFVTPLPETMTAPAATDARAAALAPDRAALSARYGVAAEAVLDRRRERVAVLYGTGRLPTLIAALLGAAGIGHIDVRQPGAVGLRDTIPGGLSVQDEGRRVSLSAAEAVHRGAPGVDTSPVGSGAADLIVVATGTPVPRDLRTLVTAEDSAHLVTGVWAGHAVIGPLVSPGRSSCLSCADLHRRDRDPAWPALAVQLAGRPAARDPAEVALCALAAALTVVQALGFLDGEDVATLGGTLELLLPDWRLRRRSWPVHPDCRCASPRRPEASTVPGARMDK